MTKYIIAVVALLVFTGCAKQHDITVPPGQIDAHMGPKHQHIQIKSARGRGLLNIDVDEDGQDIQLRREQEQRIQIRRK